MNITKELLEHLGVVSLTLSDGIADTLCFLRRHNQNQWTLSVPSNIKAQRNITCQIRFKDHTAHFLTDIIESGEDYCVITVPSAIEQGALKAFIHTLNAMEWQDEEYGRRKERRIEIGKANAAAFGLTSTQQTLFQKGIKLVQPCAIADASLHGIRIITPYSLAIRNMDIFSIKVQFTKPEQTAILQAHKVHNRLNRIGEKTYASIACQLLEPIHFVWKERVIAMLAAANGTREI